MGSAFIQRRAILTNIDCSSVCVCFRGCFIRFFFILYFLPLCIRSHSFFFFALLCVFVVCARLFFVTLNSISDCITTNRTKNVYCSALHWIYDVDSSVNKKKIACWSNAIGLWFWVWIVSKINFIYVSFYRCFMLNDSEIVVVRHFVGLFVCRISLFFCHCHHQRCSRSHRRRLCCFYCCWCCALPHQKLIELLKCANPKMEMNWR